MVTAILQPYTCGTRDVICTLIVCSNLDICIVTRGQNSVEVEFASQKNVSWKSVNTNTATNKPAREMNNWEVSLSTYMQHIHPVLFVGGEGGSQLLNDESVFAQVFTRVFTPKPVQLGSLAKKEVEAAFIVV